MFRYNYFFIQCMLVLLLNINHLNASMNFIDEKLYRESNFKPTINDDWTSKVEYTKHGNVNHPATQFSLQLDCLSPQNLLTSIDFVELNTSYIFTKNQSPLTLRYTFNPFYKKFLDKKIHDMCFNFLIQPNENKTESLKILYDLKAIPDFVINTICGFKELNIVDFRGKTEKL